MRSIAGLELDTHVVHLKKMCVYAFAGECFIVPEGYLTVKVTNNQGVWSERQILYPNSPRSIYHVTKSMDQVLFQFYPKNNEICITDLHQGTVWGTQTDETSQHEALINRFDDNGGTVFNRFLMQAVLGHPLTVHGADGQTRAFIHHIQDTVRCVARAVAYLPETGAPVKIMNQVTEQYRLRDLAEIGPDLTGAQIAMVDKSR